MLNQIRISSFYALMFFSCATIAQKSTLYNSKRQLKADTNFTLSELEMKEWEYLEASFMEMMVKNYEIPLICVENNVPFKGVFEFTYNGLGKFTLNQFHSLKLGDREQLLISSFINPNFEETLAAFAVNHSWLIERIKTKGLKFYLPFGFYFLNVEELVDSNGYLMPRVIQSPLIEQRR